MEFSDSRYRNLISHIDIDRDGVEYIHFDDPEAEPRISGFLDDMKSNNDSIELNLIKNKAYKEGVIMPLHIINAESDLLKEILRDEQKTFGGSKLFYINKDHDKILVISVPKSVEGKLNMVINKINKVNDRISRINSKIKKDNVEAYMKRKSVHDKKDEIVNMINSKLKV